MPRRLTPVWILLLEALLLPASGLGQARAEYHPDRCEWMPLPDHQVSFQIDGEEKGRWHFGAHYPRPFFFPFNGPSGVSLTRMGHPGAQNHDHHRSIWFAHQSVNEVDFWSDNTPARIRQKYWYRYRDGNEEGVMAATSGWFDGDGRELMEQDTVAALIPMERGEHALELQITFRPPAGAETVELGKTNFGFLAVRVSKTLSNYFGGGDISSSEGGIGEEAIFGRPARWMDYSGPVTVGTGPERKTVIEGITYFDHPSNLRYPTPWHVRSDGWMGASFCLENGHTITREAPLVLRYLLHAHAGPCEPNGAAAVAEAFAARPGFVVAKSSLKHRQYEVWREGSEPRE